MFHSGLIVVITGLATLFGIAYVYFTSRHRERMALIERGLSASVLETEPQRYQSLKYGLVGLSLGIGLLIGAFVERYTWLDTEIAYLATGLIGGSIGLLIFHFGVIRRSERL